MPFIHIYDWYLDEKIIFFDEMDGCVFTHDQAFKALYGLSFFFYNTTYIGMRMIYYLSK